MTEKHNLMRKAIFGIAVITSLTVSAVNTTDTLFVYMKDGGLNAFPSRYVTQISEYPDSISISTIDNNSYSYSMDDVERWSHEAPHSPMPVFTAFKFGSSCNDELYSDADAIITSDSVITVTVGTIGKWLTPSFVLSDQNALAYIDGDVLTSGKSRRRFEGDVTCVIARRGESILSPAETSSDDTLSMQPYGRRYRLSVDIASVGAVSVPRMDINISGGVMVSSKDNYLDASITIDGAGVYPSMAATDVQIKGRGNTSWSSNPWDKNPYRLKFKKKQAPFGLTKAKSWVLQANKQTRSMLANAVGMKIARLVGTAAANHVVPSNCISTAIIAEATSLQRKWECLQTVLLLMMKKWRHCWNLIPITMRLINFVLGNTTFL